MVKPARSATAELRLAERDNTIAHWPEGNTGNHFVPMELPDMNVADIRAFFGKVA